MALRISLIALDPFKNLAFIFIYFYTATPQSDGFTHPDFMGKAFLKLQRRNKSPEFLYS